MPTWLEDPFQTNSQNPPKTEMRAGLASGSLQSAELTFWKVHGNRTGQIEDHSLS
jgi:hypothetical protein